MNISFPLLALTLLFWGWRVDQLWGAIAMALLLEGSRFLSWRWHPEDRELHQVSDLGGLILAGFFFYYFLSETHTTLPAIEALHIFPFAFFPLMLAQAYTTRGDFPLSGLFYSLRHQPASERRSVQLDYPFFGICLIASMAGVRQSPWYFPGMFILIGIALWPHRPKRYRLSLWMLLLLLVFGLADQEQRGILFLHHTVSDAIAEWAWQWFKGEPDPYQQETAIGTIGRLKLSDHILFRVDQPSPWTVPLRLREASYNRLIGNTWYGPPTTFQELPMQEPEGSWQLVDHEQGSASLTIYYPLSGKSAMVVAPQGAIRLEALPALSVSVNHYGAIKVKEPPDFVSYRVWYDPKRSFDAPPGKTDLLIPTREKAVIEKIANQLALATLPTEQALERLSRFFTDHFRYTLRLTDTGSASTPLARFLLENRAGHCEYFASATVLLLRQIGIPARYVVGYSVQESEGRLRIVRARHAHAWALAYLNGVWQEIDNTPSDWGAREQENTPYWSIVTDLWSRMWFLIDQYRSSTGPRTTWPWLVLVTLLTVVMIWRIVRGTSLRRKITPPTRCDSISDRISFIQIEAALTRQGWGREMGEPLGNWLRRIHHAELLPLLRLYYRDRYDPRGLSAEERMSLSLGVDAWLRQQRS